MRRRLGYLVPLLVAAFPALFYTSTNRGEFWPGETVGVVLLLLVIAFVSYVLLRLAVPRARADNVAAATAALLAWLLVSNMVADRAPVGAARTAVKVAIAAGALLLAWRLLRHGEQPHALVRALSVFVVALVLPAAARTAYYEISDADAVARSPFRHVLAAPVATRATAGGQQQQRQRPDIYLLILDTFSSPEVMRDYFGYDDTPFVDSLRSLGFKVPAVTASNYPYTAYSVASLLNMEYLTPLRAERRRSGKDVGILYAITRDNRVARVLKDNGYTIYFEPNVTYAGTRQSANADVVFGPMSAQGPLGWPDRSNLWHLVWQWTLLERLPAHLGFTSDPAAPAAASISAVAEVAPRPGPKFVFMHSLMPHPPYSFDAQCHARPIRPAADRAAYVDVVRCVQQLTLGAVTGILRRSARPAVIVIQGDHGSFPPDLPNRATALTASQVRERFGPFGAYRVPPGYQLASDDTVSVVNVFRDVLSDAVGADLPALPDSIYFPEDVDRHPLQFQVLPDSFFAAVVRRGPATRAVGVVASDSSS